MWQSLEVSGFNPPSHSACASTKVSATRGQNTRKIGLIPRFDSYRDALKIWVQSLSLGLTPFINGYLALYTSDFYIFKSWFIMMIFQPKYSEIRSNGKILSFICIYFLRSSGFCPSGN